MNYVVMLSGGLDSTTALAHTIDLLGPDDNIMALSFKYGQRHANKELECAKSIVDYYKVDHQIIDLSNTDIFSGSNSPLLNEYVAMPTKSYAEQLKEKPEGMVSTYVPFRNGLMLSIAASVALSNFGDNPCTLIIAAHMDDAAGDAYPDCSRAFVTHMDMAIWQGTGGLVEIEAPFVEMTKGGIVRRGLQLNVPYHKTWSCYQGGQKACGVCGTCIDRLKAFAENNTTDPINYENGV